MASLVSALIWCCSLAVLATTAEAAEQQSYEPVSSAQAELKKLTKRLEAGLTEISSQKQATAALLEEVQLALREVKAQKEETDQALRVVLLQKEETEKALGTVTHQKAETETALESIKRETDESRKALAAVNVQKDSILRVLQLIKAQKEETGRVLRQMETQKEATEKALETMHSQMMSMDNTLETVEGQSNKTAKVLESMETQGATILELSSRFENQTAKTDEALSALDSAGQRFAKELTDLKTQKTSVEEAMMKQGAEWEEYKANMSEIVGKQAEDCEKAVEQSDRLEAALLRFEAWKNEIETEEVTTSQAETTTDPSKLETLSSTAVTPTAVNSTVALPSEEPSTGAPPTAVQIYLTSGLAGLTGKRLNMENVYYKGEFLYLARNPTDRSANVVDDGATLAVDADKLLESAFQWEFVRVPGEDSSVVYLRNKLNELKPIPSRLHYPGRRNYIQIETVSSPKVGEASQLVITMKETVDNEYYYHPHSRPNTNSALNGREISWDDSPSWPGTKWIVTLASETLGPTTDHSPEFNSTVAPPPEEPSTGAPPTAVQIYLSSGLAGLIGKPLNIENEHYKGEFLYLARNPTDRKANVLNDAATLAVGGDKLRRSAFQWEFVRIPGEDSSVVYLRNKFNELKPIPSKEDRYGGWNYIRIKTISSPTGGEPSQLVIRMMETVNNLFYYLPRSTPNTVAALNGREIQTGPSPSRPGTKWIVTLAS